MEHPRKILQAYGITPKKSLGQNFLIDDSILQKIAAAAELDQGDVVLEIGPGLGALTVALASQAKRVVAVEIDNRFVPILDDQLEAFSNVELINQNILNLDVNAVVAQPYKVVANVPYYITGAIIRKFLDARWRPSIMVLTVQREVADRIMAEPGDMSVLAVSAQLYARVTKVARIKAGSFYPRPEVESSVIKFDFSEFEPYQIRDESLLFRVVKAGFSQKRKQLRNSLAGGLGIQKNQADQYLGLAEIEPKRRAESLSVDEWVNLANAIATTT